MNCPNCKTEMEDGRLITNGAMWTFGWSSSDRNRMKELVGAEVQVGSYRCPKCGKIELYSVVK